VKPFAFDYCAPRTLEEALDVVGQMGDRAKPLAGGQSLGPLLNLRLARPEMLVDLNRLTGVDDIVLENGTVRCGAMVRQRSVERSEVVKEAVPLLHEAIRWIGHPTIRNRGTVGGSLSHADPAAELPVVATALGAELILARAGAERTVGAGDFFKTFLTTDLAEDELLVGVRWPVAGDRTGQAFEEHARRHGDFALVSAAASVEVDESGRCTAARLVHGGVHEVPFVSPAARLLVGERADDELVEQVANEAAAACSPLADPNASPGYRRRLVKALTAAAVRRALERALGEDLGKGRA